MEDKNDGFVFFHTYYEAMQYLPDKERLALYDAMCKFGLYGLEPEGLPPMAQGQFILQRPNIEASLRRYKANKRNGAKGGAPKGNQNARKNNPITTEKQPNINLNNDNEKENDKENDKEKERDKEIKAPALHGQYNNVSLTADDLDKLQREYLDWHERIESLSEYKASTGKEYASDYATIRRWAKKDAEQQSGSTQDWCSQTNRTPYSDEGQYIPPELLED